MTTTFTGVCGIAGCQEAIDWSVGPGLCEYHYELFVLWKEQNDNDVSIEAWLESAALGIGV